MGLVGFVGGLVMVREAFHLGRLGYLDYGSCGEMGKMRDWILGWIPNDPTAHWRNVGDGLME